MNECERETETETETEKDRKGDRYGAQNGLELGVKMEGEGCVWTWMPIAARDVAFMPDAHTLLTVVLLLRGYIVS
jgi:hypothetical protein